MKHYILLCFMAAFAFASCKKETKYKDAVYITGTESSAVKMVGIEGAPSNIAALSLSASTRVTEDINATFAPAPDLVKEYNDANGTKYYPLPNGCYRLTSTQGTIKKGSYISDPIGVTITSVDSFKEGRVYLLPVTVKNVTGNLNILQSSQTVYYIINKTIITRAADISNGGYFTPTFNTDTNVSKLKNMTAITMEVRINANSWQTRDPYISTVMGTEEHFLLRFGDVTTPNNVLQFARGGTKLSSATAFSTGVWYHVALTYDGNTLKMYVNGKLDATMAAVITPIDLTYAAGGNGVFMIGRSANGRGFSGSISECRVWSRALSQSEIQANMCYVDPASPGLEAYWRMDQSTDSKFYDLSPNGHNAIGTNVTKWTTNVRCPQ